MSVNLTVKVRQMIDYEDVLALTAKNVSRMLGMSVPTNILSQSSSTGQVKEIGLSEFDDIIFFSDYPKHIVEIGTIFVPSTPGWEDPDQEGWWFDASIRASHDDALKYVLFLAVTVAFAKCQNMPVVDETGLFSKGVREYDVDSFLKLISLEYPQSSFEGSLHEYVQLINRLHQQRTPPT